MSLDAPRGTDRVVRALVALLREPPADAPRVEALTPAAPPPRVTAIDGSSVVLARSGERVLAAYRAARITLAPGNAPVSHAPAANIVLLSAFDARDALSERLAAAGLPTDLLPQVDAAGAIDALRTLEEHEAALAALPHLEAGDLLLLDGALAARPGAPALDRVLAQAATRRIDVVGVCKTTTMSIGGAPALVACSLAARGERTWLAPLPPAPHARAPSFAARLSAAEPRAFRFDVATTRDPRAVLANVAGLCGHPAYPGYPSPIAMAHNAALLNDDTRRRLLALVQEGALKAGVDPDAWDAAFVDYHDVLETGA